MDKHVYLTKEGLEKLQQDLENMKTVRRKEVAERLKQAIGFGDLSENSGIHRGRDPAYGGNAD